MARASPSGCEELSFGIASETKWEKVSAVQLHSARRRSCVYDLRREEAMICAIYSSRSARALFCIKRIVITNVERSKASLKSRSILLRRSFFYDAKKCKLDVLSQSTMSNAKVERVGFRRGRQVNVVKSNKKEVIVLFS